MKHTALAVVSAIIVLGSIWGLSSFTGTDASELTYTISIDRSQPHCQLVVRLTFVGDNDGSTILKIPHAWAWQDTYEKGIKDIKTIDADASVLEIPDEYACEIRHRPSADVTVEYRVIQYWNEPVTRDVYYRPILKEDYFHFIGHAVFVCPDWDLNEPRKIRLVWNIPADDWNLANSFAVGQRSQMIERSLNEFCHAVFMGGDITVHEVDIYGCPLYISIQGQYRFDSNDFYDMVGKTARAVREYWQDYRFPYFLVTMIPTNQPCCSQGGTGLTNSYSLFISEEIDDVDDMKFLLTHEIFHVWNGRKIQREEPEELVYWFAEGFTDYFTRLILLRAGLITMPEYIDDVNSTIAELYESPARNITNRRILEKTHVDYTVECIPYLRGDLLALRWDARIKKTGSGNSLDNLMKDLLAAAVQSGVLVSAANIDSLISPYLPGGAMPDIRDYIDKGRMIPISSDALGPCAHLDTAECTPFDLGFTYERPPEGESWKIFGVDPDGPAYAAGLRNGQILLGRSITWNDTKKPVVLKIRDQNGVESILEYLPEGKSFSVPQFVFDSAAYNADSSYCHEWFGY